MGTYCTSFKRLFYWGLAFFVVHFGFTSFVPLSEGWLPLGINPDVRTELEVSSTQGDELELKLQTFEELWREDVNRYFWTFFIYNTILQQNPHLDPVAVIDWANVWYLMCSETGENIPLTLAIAHVESATWERIEDRDVLVRFHPCAISLKGAMGLFQLMSSTAREVAGELGIYYDNSVESPSDAIISVSRDTSTSPDVKRKLIRRMILNHAEKHPGSIEAVALNPMNNIRMGIYYFAHLSPAKRAGLSTEARIESYNAGFVGYVRGWGREETVPYRNKVMWRYGVYKNQADSTRFFTFGGEQQHRF